METKGPEGQTESPQEASAATKEGGGEFMGMGMMKKMMGQMGQMGQAVGDHQDPRLFDT